MYGSAIRRLIGGAFLLALVGMLAVGQPVSAEIHISGEGFQVGASRDYFPKSGTASADSGSYEFLAEIAQFDTEEHARAYFTRQHASSFGEQVRVTEPLDLGKAIGTERSSWRLWDKASVEDTIDHLSVLDGTTVYSFMVKFQGKTALEVVDKAMEDFAAAVVSRPAGTSAAEFKDDGTSTGGLFEKFPPNGDPVLLGLLATVDDVYPEVGG